LAHGQTDTHTLNEVKCWTPIRKFQALGHGSTKKGGAVSTNEGSHIAFGGTAESARHLTLGCKQRGTADQAPFDHATGVGHVAGHAGHYADALAKGRQVVLIVIETTGAVHPEDAVGMLYAWHAETRAEGCIDRTRARSTARRARPPPPSSRTTCASSRSPP
ncbi:hypothetical protein Ctob_014513, partial [Chrysochromulina tobinii]